MKLCLDGRPLHRGWWGGQRLWRGNLVIEERMDTVTSRVMSQAFMRHSKHQDVSELGTLYDARLLKMRGEFVILTGFEREPILGREVRQSWMLRAISQEEADTPYSR